ncbi:MAG: hypothetical protein ACFBSC_22650 [Microcoleaceae cyanobacterium]
MSKQTSKPKLEIRFRVSEDLFSVIQEIQEIGHFDSIGAAARFVVKMQSKSVLASLSQMETGPTLPTNTTDSPQETAKKLPPNALDDSHVPESANHQNSEPPKNFTNQFASLRKKINPQ